MPLSETLQTLNPLTHLWWDSPALPTVRLRCLGSTSTPIEDVPYRATRERVGTFVPSRRWVYYNRLQAVDVGYIVDLYSLKEIAKRYGLSGNSSKYFKKYILPPPLQIVRRRSVSSHHWSRFTLKALDVVLKDLERNNLLTFNKKYVDHVRLVAAGTDAIGQYYNEQQLNQDETLEDKYGVFWL